MKPATSKPAATPSKLPTITDEPKPCPTSERIAALESEVETQRQHLHAIGEMLRAVVMAQGSSSAALRDHLNLHGATLGANPALSADPLRTR